MDQWEFVLHTGDAAVWVTGVRPRGKGFNLDLGARVDTSTWLQVTGTVAEARGVVRVEASQQPVLAKPDLSAPTSEAPPVHQAGPAPEVVFSDPQDGDTNVPLGKTIVIQFSRDMDPASFKGNLHWRSAAADSQDELPRSGLEVKYEKSNRSIEVKMDADDVAPNRNVVLELPDSIHATDGAPLKSWSMTFTFGAQ